MYTKTEEALHEQRLHKFLAAEAEKEQKDSLFILPKDSPKRHKSPVSADTVGWNWGDYTCDLFDTGDCANSPLLFLKDEEGNQQILCKQHQPVPWDHGIGVNDLLGLT